METTKFQFTPLREGRLMSEAMCLSYLIFQFTPLREGRLEKFRTKRNLATYFNSRPCERGDRESKKEFLRKREFQFTPLREGRHHQCEAGGHPAVFQFTPLREGRPLPPPGNFCNFDFNSRPCERGDKMRPGLNEKGQRISIHAPARGATLGMLNLVLRQFQFQFTPLREGRPSHFPSGR